jgi:DNA-binding PadR family transcriptional regulator
MFRFLILGLLRNGSRMHGYALVKQYRERSGIEVSTGNFYRELQRLVVDGLIRSTSNPPDADARRTPYQITEVGAAAFDEWFSAPDAAGGIIPEDDLSARALFMGDSDQALVRALLEHMEENLWFAGKTLERARQMLLTRSPSTDRLDVLPLLLARRLKRLAADLEFVEDFEALYAEWQTKAHRQAPTGVATFGPKDARARKLVIGPHGTARP